MNYFDYLKAKCVAVKFVAESTESGSLFTQSSWRINDSPNSAVMYKLAKISLNYAETLLCFYSWNQVCLKKKFRKLLKLCNWYVKKVAKNASIERIRVVNTLICSSFLISYFTSLWSSVFLWEMLLVHVDIYMKRSKWGG